MGVNSPDVGVGGKDVPQTGWKARIASKLGFNHGSQTPREILKSFTFAPFGIAENNIEDPQQVDTDHADVPGQAGDGMTGNNDQTVYPEMPKPPSFIREFSKKHSKDERDELARWIKAERSQYFARKKDLGKRKLELPQELHEKRLESERALQELGQVQNTINELSSNWIMRTLRHQSLKKLAGEQEVRELTVEQVLENIKLLEAEERDVMRKLEERGISAELGKSRQLLQDFYNVEKKKWSHAPYDVEEMKRFFTPEYVAKLSLDEYIELLKRFPSGLLTHVTRQGVRDHWGHGGNAGGMWEYSNGFVDILKSGKLDSKIGLVFKDGMTKEAMRDFLGKYTFSNKENAIHVISRLTDHTGGVGSYHDNSSVHFAAEAVADTYYGSETGNEIFFTFPSALIAANYLTEGNLTVSGSDLGWNDAWIWNEDNHGIPVDSGIAFLPASASVSKRTGSQYELGQDLKPVVEVERVELFNQLMALEGFVNLLQEVDGVYKGRQIPYQSRGIVLGDIGERLQKDYIASDPVLVNAILYSNTPVASIDTLLYCSGLESGKINNPDALRNYHERGGMKTAIRDFLENSRALYKLASDPVRSNEYWEDFFKKNLSLRPSKIVYYNGDPTSALENFKRKAGLSQSGYGQENSPVLEEIGSQRRSEFEREKSIFHNLALEVINEMFPEAA